MSLQGVDLPRVKASYCQLFGLKLLCRLGYVRFNQQVNDCSMYGGDGYVSSNSQSKACLSRGSKFEYCSEATGLAISSVCPSENISVMMNLDELGGFLFGGHQDRKNRNKFHHGHRQLSAVQFVAEQEITIS